MGPLVAAPTLNGLATSGPLAAGAAANSAANQAAAHWLTRQFDWLLGRSPATSEIVPFSAIPPVAPTTTALPEAAVRLSIDSGITSSAATNQALTGMDSTAHAIISSLGQPLPITAPTTMPELAVTVSANAPTLFERVTAQLTERVQPVVEHVANTLSTLDPLTIGLAVGAGALGYLGFRAAKAALAPPPPPEGEPSGSRHRPHRVATATGLGLGRYAGPLLLAGAAGLAGSGLGWAAAAALAVGAYAAKKMTDGAGSNGKSAPQRAQPLAPGAPATAQLVT